MLEPPNLLVWTLLLWPEIRLRRQGFNGQGSQCTFQRVRYKNRTENSFPSMANELKGEGETSRNNLRARPTRIVFALVMCLYLDGQNLRVKGCVIIASQFPPTLLSFGLSFTQPWTQKFCSPVHVCLRLTLYVLLAENLEPQN